MSRRQLRRWRWWTRCAGSISDLVGRADAAGALPEAQSPFRMAEETRRLEREVRRLQTENGMLLKASAFFASRSL